MMIGILLGLQLLGGWPGLHLQPPMASLALASKPSESQFVLYNVQGQVIHQGQTPFVGMIPAGRYRLVVTKAGYFQEQRSLSLEPNQQQILQIELFPQATSPQPPVVARGTPNAPPSNTVPQAPTSRPVNSTTTTSQPSTSHSTPPPPQNTTPPATQQPQPPPASSRQTPPAANVAKAKVPPKTTARKIPWLPLAAAAGLAVAGGIFWGLSGGALDASKDVNRTQIEAYNEYSQARSHRSTAVFLFAGGGVALGLAALFYFWPPSSDNKTKQKPAQGHDVPILGFSLDLQ